MALNIAGERIIFVNTASLLNEVCDESRFKKVVHAGLEALRSMAGDGLFTAYNEELNWGIAHRILMPVFGPMKIREMLPQMKDVASQMLLKWYVLNTSKISLWLNQGVTNHQTGPDMVKHTTLT